MLADLCGCDRGPEEDPRFEVNYHLFSTKHHNRLRLKVLLSEDDPHVATVTHALENGRLARARNVRSGRRDLRRPSRSAAHPCCRRDFDGHALRKDYPLRGYEPYSLN